MIGTGSFPGVESGRGVYADLLVPRSKTAALVLSLRVFVACKKGETYLYNAEHNNVV
jgi:hypothetical protein